MISKNFASASNKNTTEFTHPHLDLPHTCQFNLLNTNPKNLIKHTQTIRRQQLTNCVSVFDHFLRLVLKGLGWNISSRHFLVKFPNFRQELLDARLTYKQISNFTASVAPKLMNMKRSLNIKNSNTSFGHYIR